MWSRFRPVFTVAAIVLLVAGGAAALLYHRSTEGSQAAGSGVWTCSMHTQVRQPGPGKCPICGMDLIPVEQLSSAQALTQEQAGLLTEPVKRRELFKEVRTVGKLDYNERQVAYITARIAGRVDRVFADFTGIQVRQGDHLVDLYSPELVVAQGELIRAAEAVRSRGRTGEPGTYADAALEAARSKLRLWGLSDEQLQEIERSGKTQTHLTVFAPRGGTVIEKSVRAGQYVKEGDMLYRIADLDPIWLYLDVYESDLAWVRFGQPVEVTVEAFPGENFHGRVTFVDPFLDDRSRTVKARVNLKNPDRRLKPAMYAHATIRTRLLPDASAEPTGLEGKYVCPMHPEIIRDKPGQCPVCSMALEKVPKAAAPGDHLAHAGHGGEETAKGVLSVPASAVLDTGRRRVAYREAQGGAYELVEVQVGPLAHGTDDQGRSAEFLPVLGGLKEGDRVVARGGFLLDSQRQIEGMPSLLYPEGQSAANLHSGHGAAPRTPPQQPTEGSHKH